MADIFSCAFTGHRPQSLSFGYSEEDSACVALKQTLLRQIEKLYARGVNKFYTGCALGVDMWAAEAVIALKRRYDDIKLFSIVPFKQQAKRWSASQIARYQNLLDKSYEVTILNSGYTRECYFERNRYLMEHSDMLLAVYDTSFSGSRPSGTGYTVNYALSLKKPILLINPETLKIYTSKGADEH